MYFEEMAERQMGFLRLRHVSGAGVRVLLVSHEASRSGAPRVAALIARSLVDLGIDVRIVSRTNGPMMDDFRAVAPSSIEFLNRVRRRLRANRLTGRFGRLADTLVATGTIVRTWPDVVYVNSTAAAVYLGPAVILRRRVILHGHESESIARQFLEDVHATPDLPGVEIIACSASVQAGLAGVLHREPLEVRVLPSVPDAKEVQRRAVEAPSRAYEPEDLIIGCCGTAEARKGVDLWVNAARIVLAKRPDQSIRFVWVGDIAETIVTRPGEHIDFIGPSANPWAHMRRFDVATLPSRDDPFPLVVLESMSLGKPVVAFGVGGVPNQVGDAGVVVAPGDVAGFAGALLTLIDDPELRAQLGAAARDRVAVSYSFGAFAQQLERLVVDEPQRG